MVVLGKSARWLPGTLQHLDAQGHDETLPAVRAGKLGLPLSLGIIAGDVRRFAPLVELYRATALEAGHPENAVKVSINAHGYVADSRPTVRSTPSS